MTSCPSCADPLALDAPFCPSCTARLRWNDQQCAVDLPAIRPGEVLVSRDFRVSPLPGLANREYVAKSWTSQGTEAGIEFRVTRKNVGMSFWEPRLRIRHVCVRTSARVLDAAMCFGLVVRDEPVGDASTRYFLSAVPSTGTVVLLRSWISEADLGSTELASSVGSSALHGVGTFNELELRAQDATLEAWVNGTRVLATHDPSFGIGRVGIDVATRNPSVALGRGSVELAGFEVRGVAP